MWHLVTATTLSTLNSRRYKKIMGREATTQWLHTLAGNIKHQRFKFGVLGRLINLINCNGDRLLVNCHC